MRNLATLLTIPAIAMSVAGVACSGAAGSEFGSGSNPNGGSSGPDTPAGDITGGGTGPSGTSAACVSSTANAALAGANLVVMFDKSGSMGDPAEGFDPAARWTPVTTAMKAFFQDPSSVGIQASLQFFPQGGDLASVCGYVYATPAVAMAPLTNAKPILDALDGAKPYGGTPTLPALTGAVKYAQGVAQLRPDEKTVVVLVTDGQPGFGINGQYVTGCADNDVPHVAAMAQTAAAGNPKILTYVIGVGPSLQDLNTVAAAGGTGQAIMVPVNDPTQTKAAFQAALEQIRAQTFSCSFALPPPPSGQQIDTNAVNVVYTGGDGKESILAYSADCSNAGGWHYDKPGSPTKIELCATSCSAAQADHKGKLSLAFGCRTLTTPR